MTDPRSPQLQAEIQRVVRRWRELPLDHALLRAPLLRRFVEDLVRETRGAATQLPDLGPAALADQFAVITYDAAAAGVPDLANRVGALRRELG